MLATFLREHPWMATQRFPLTNRSDSGSVRGRMFVKICGITNEDDALLAVAMGADAVGFIFAPSPRQIAPQQAYDITRRLPPEILTVGVFRDEHPKRVVELAHRSGVKAAQLHGNEIAARRRRGRRSRALGHQGLPGRLAARRRRGVSWPPT